MILDTNALSAFADGDPALGVLIEGASSLAIPAVVLGEYHYGVRCSRHRTKYQAWLDQTLRSHRILSTDEQTAHFYAEIRLALRQVGRPIPANDLWIAALARQHRMPILSRDGHFDRVTSVSRVEW